jgi:cysteinyl-tRNA synthetase
LRLFFLSTHYRNQLSFSGKALSDADQRVEYFYETIRKAKERIGGAAVMPASTGEYLREFEARMNDDFNSAGALAAVSALFAEINEVSGKTAFDPATRSKLLIELLGQVQTIGNILGLFNAVPEEWLLQRRGRAARQRGIDEKRVQSLIAERAEARRQRNFSRADAIRSELWGMGVELMDSASSSTWKVIPAN